jgi:uncharacterized membrane protein
MTREVFLKQMAESLKRLPKADVDDIIADYEEYFAYGAGEGRSEQELCQRLGDPKKLAKEYSVQKYIEKAKEERTAGSMAKAFFSSAGLGVIDFLYVVFAVVTGYIALSALYIAVCAVAVAGVAAVVCCIAYMGMLGFLQGLFGIFAGGLLIALGILGFIGLMQTGRLFRRGNMLFLSRISERIKGGKSNEQN